jgi:L-arabinose isomerase
MIELADFEVWFLTGSQHLYGPEAIEQVGIHSQEIAGALNRAEDIPTKVVYKPVLTTPEAIQTI